jgi:hypothetical protein
MVLGCPIRISTDQFICADPRSFSQLITSFIASESLGIPHAPLIRLRDFYSSLLLLNMSMNSLSRIRDNVGNISFNTNATLFDDGREQMFVSRKEVFQPHLPVRLPCYDLAPVADFTLTVSLTYCFRSPRLPWLDGRCVQGPGTYSPRHS